MRRICVDESAPKQLSAALRARGFDVHPLPRAWYGLVGGELLGQLQATGFDVLLTCDASMRYQQNLRDRRVSLVVVSSNRRRALMADLDRVAAALRRAARGRIIEVMVTPIRRLR